MEESHSDARGAESRLWRRVTPVEECRGGGRVTTPVDESSSGGEESSPLTTPTPWRNRRTVFFFWLGLAGLSDENRSDISLGKGRLRCNEHYWMAEISWIL